MGMVACYLEAKVDIINKLEKLKEADELLEQLEELQEEKKANLLDVDKMWDALHFLLTGESGKSAIENNLLSYAIIGEVTLNEDDYISYITPEKVEEIKKELTSLDFDEIILNFSPEEMIENDIYPKIWEDLDEEEAEEIKEELLDNLNALKRFYNAVAKNKNGIVISIY